MLNIKVLMLKTKVLAAFLLPLSQGTWRQRPDRTPSAGGLLRCRGRAWPEDEGGAAARAVGHAAHPGTVGKGGGRELIE